MNLSDVYGPPTMVEEPCAYGFANEAYARRDGMTLFITNGLATRHAQKRVIGTRRYELALVAPADYIGRSVLSRMGGLTWDPIAVLAPGVYDPVYMQWAVHDATIEPESYLTVPDLFRETTGVHGFVFDVLDEPELADLPFAIIVAVGLTRPEVKLCQPHEMGADFVLTALREDGIFPRTIPGRKSFDSVSRPSERARR
jgi:hypothetical protein